MLNTVIAALAIWQQTGATWDPGKHAALLDAQFTTVEQTVRNLETKRIDAKTAVGRLGEVLGESRKAQDRLNQGIRGSLGTKSTLVLRIVQAQGVFDAYVSSRILALDGDADSKDLARVLQLRLQKLLPAFRKK